MKRMHSLLAPAALIVVLIACFSCNKTPAPVISKIDVSTRFDSAERNAAYLGGMVKSNGVEPITERGICWDSLSGVNIKKHIVTSSADTGNFTVKITDLSSGNTYFAKAYARTATQTVYGTEINFTTKAAPVVTTTAATNISYNGCTSGGTVNGAGSEPILQKGVCWNTTGNPTLTDQKTENGPGDGPFTSVLDNLAYGTLYYLRAFATTVVGTTYGPEITFTTSPVALPTVSTSPITNISANAATGGGNVTSDGGAPIIKRGVCWNFAGSPPNLGCVYQTNDGTGTGSFTSSIQGLVPFSEYTVKAYATNVAGTAYGQSIFFRTLSTQLPGPGLLLPANNAPVGCCSVNFSWNQSVYAEYYVLQVSTSPVFDGQVYQRDVGCTFGASTPSTTGVLSNMVYGSTYCMKMDNATLNGTWYWRVRFFGAGAFSEWSATRSFTFSM